MGLMSASKGCTRYWKINSRRTSKVGTEPGARELGGGVIGQNHLQSSKLEVTPQGCELDFNLRPSPGCYCIRYRDAGHGLVFVVVGTMTSRKQAWHQDKLMFCAVTDRIVWQIHSKSSCGWVPVEVLMLRLLQLISNYPDADYLDRHGPLGKFVQNSTQLICHEITGYRINYSTELWLLELQIRHGRKVYTR